MSSSHENDQKSQELHCLQIAIEAKSSKRESRAKSLNSWLEKMFIVRTKNVLILLGEYLLRRKGQKVSFWESSIFE